MGKKECATGNTGKRRSDGPGDFNLDAERVLGARYETLQEALTALRAEYERNLGLYGPRRADKKIPYMPEYAAIAQLACEVFGASHDQIAEFLGIDRNTYRRWMNANPEFARAISVGRDRFDTQKVERRLLERALGYQVEEKTVQIDHKGRRTEYIKQRHIPPEIDAQKFWLTNRARDRWRARIGIEFQAQIPGNIEIIDNCRELPAAGEKRLTNDHERTDQQGQNTIRIQSETDGSQTPAG